MFRRFRYTLYLPKDGPKGRQLMIKSRQYDERMANIENQVVNGGNPSQLFDLRHYEYRQAIISHLLLESQVNLGELQRQLERSGHLPTGDLDSWFMACVLMIDYVLFDGLHTIGGMGLPDVKPPPA